MIRGNDILSENDDVSVRSIAKGYVVKCNSPIGICFDTVEKQYADSDGTLRGTIPRRKSRAKFYLIYVSTEYEDERGWTNFTRTEYFLPDETPIFVNDCMRGHGHCNHLEDLKVVELFNDYRNGLIYRKKKVSKPKKRIVIKKKKCGCK
jgi:hypothetical protein